MVQTYRLPNRTAAATGAVAASLIAISSIDGFLKNTHGNFIFFILKDVTLVSILIVMLIGLALKPWERPTGRWQMLGLWGAYIGYLFLQIFNPTMGLSASIAGFRAEALFALLFFVGAVYFTSGRRLARTVDVALFWLAIAAGAGLLEAFAPDTWNALSPGLAAASHKYTSWSAPSMGLPMAVVRAYGTLVDPAAMGAGCMAGFLFSAGALARTRGFWRIWNAFLMVLFAVVLELSGSRLALAGLAAGLLTFLVLSLSQKSMRLPAIVTMCILLAAIPIALQASAGGGTTARLDEQSVQYAAMTRARSQGLVLASLLKYPFGLGLGATGAGGRQNANHDARVVGVDNIYFAILYQTGVPGLIIFLAFQAGLLLATVRCVSGAKSVQTRATYISMASLQVALLVAGLYTQGVFAYAPVAQLFWLFSGTTAFPKRVEGEKT